MKRLLLALLLLSSGAAMAQTTVPVKDSKQLEGCWRRHIFTQAAMNRLSSFDIFDPVQQKYQWFCFRANGDFRALTNSKDDNPKTADIDRLTGLFPGSQSWKLVEPGVIHIENRADASQTHKWNVRFTAKEEKLDRDVTVPAHTLLMSIPGKAKDPKQYGTLRVLVKLDP